MNFVQTGFLIAGAAIAIPIVVHLLSRWQVQRVDLGTMCFLREIVHDAARRRTVRRWFLLLSRVAIIALLALLFSRPFQPQAQQSDGKHLRVVLIDRSASMGMPGKNGRLIDDAVSAANSKVRELDEKSNIVWAWFDDRVEPFAEGVTNPVPPNSMAGDTNFTAALQWARDILHDRTGIDSDVVLITDLQQTGLSSSITAGSAINFPADVPVEIIDVGRVAASNLAISSASTPSSRIVAGNEVNINVAMFNYAAFAYEEIPLQAVADNGQQTVRVKKSVSIASGQAEDFTFALGKLGAGRWEVSITADVEDDLAIDNSKLTAFDVADAIDVLILEAAEVESNQRPASFYLSAALDSLRTNVNPDDVNDTEGKNNPGKYRTVTMAMKAVAPSTITADRFPLVIVSKANEVSPSLIATLTNYVKDGGRLLVFVGDEDKKLNVDAWQESELSPGTFKRPLRAGATPFRITQYDRENSMLQPFADPQHGNLTRLSFRKIQNVEPRESTVVLASFDEGRPAITQQACGAGRVVWFLSSAGSNWGNWTSSPLYLPLVQQMAADLLDLSGEGTIRFRNVGDPTDWQMASANDSSLKTVAYRNEISTQDHSLAFDRPRFLEHQNRLYIVNTATKESDPSRVSKEDFAKRFDLNLTATKSPEQTVSVTKQSRNEIWPWLAAGLVVLVFGEFALSNRTSA